MHRSIALILLPIFGYSLNAFAQQPVASPPVEQIAPPQPRKQQPPGGRQPLDQGQNRTVTNADVIKMVKGGVPASAIVASIRSGPGAFDLSNGARATLFAAGGKTRVSEMTEIWDAMISKATNGRGGDDTDELNPQPSSSKGKTNAPGSAGQSGVGKTANATPASGARGGAGGTVPPGGTQKGEIPKEVFEQHIAKSMAEATATHVQGVRKPGGAEPEAVMLALMASRRQVADQEYLKLRATSTVRTIPAPQIQSAQTSSAGSAMSRGAASTAVMPATPGKNLAVASAAARPNAGLGCNLQSHPMIMLTLNGAVSPAFDHLAFTPDPQYDFYTITGCNFGEPNSNNKAWIYSTNLHGDFQIQYWSDAQIVLKLDPALSGVLDQMGQNRVSLVLQSGDGRQIKTDGFNFYAARGAQPILLRSIPASWATLTGSHDGFQPAVFTSPAAPGFFVPKAASGNTLAVYSYQPRKFAPGSDVYDLSQLASGWGIPQSSPQPPVQLIHYDVSACPGIVTYHETFGTWKATWSRNSISVDWADTTCTSFLPPPCGFVGCYATDRTNSIYSLDIYVNGPRCTDPMTGAPDGPCIQQVKQQYPQQ